MAFSYTMVKYQFLSIKAHVGHTLCLYLLCGAHNTLTESEKVKEREREGKRTYMIRITMISTIIYYVWYLRYKREREDKHMLCDLWLYIMILTRERDKRESERERKRERGRESKEEKER